MFLWCVIKFDENWNAISRDAYEQGAPHLETRERHLVSTDQTLATFPWLEAIEPLRDDQGNLVGAQIKSNFTPPQSSPTVEERMAALEASFAKNVSTSVHDKKFLAQKEVAKEFGIPWLKAHPAATKTEFEAYMVGVFATERPGEAVVVSTSGLIESYAVEARALGYIAEATFEALRDLVVSTSTNQLRKLLAKL